MIAKKVSEDNFDKNDRTIKKKTPKSQAFYGFREYFIALAKANNENRKHNNSSLDFTFFHFFNAH